MSPRWLFIVACWFGCSNGDPSAVPDGGDNEGGEEAGGACSATDPTTCVRSSGCAGTRSCNNGMWTACACPEPDLRYKLVEPGPYTGAFRQGGFDSVAGYATELASMGFVVTSIVHNSTYTLFAMKSKASQLKYETKTIEVTGAVVDTEGKTLHDEGYVVTAGALSNGGIHLLVGTRIVGDSFKYQHQIVSTPYYAIGSNLSSLNAQGYVVTACLSPSSDYYLFASKVASSTRTFVGKTTSNNVNDTEQDLATAAGQGFVPTAYCIRENDTSPGPYDLMYARDPMVSSVASKYVFGVGSDLPAMMSSLTGSGYFANLAFGFYQPYQLMGTKR